MKQKIIITTLLILHFFGTHGQHHNDIPNSAIMADKAGGGTAAWADIDGDGDIDLAFAPLDYLYLEFYVNENGSFTARSSGVYSPNGGNIDFADYDSDGDLDLVVSRSQSFGTDNFYLRLYQNINGAFSLVTDGAGLPGTESHYAKWGDYDGDGDPDLAVIVKKLGKIRGVIYRNDAGVFTDIEANLPESEDGSVDWADFDNDGDLDLLITGDAASSFEIHSTIFENDEGTFVEYVAGLTGVMYSTGLWGDYDADGDPDLVISGSTQSLNNWPFGIAESFIYRNDDGVFNDISAEIDKVLFSSADWADMDNDGDLDLLMTGMPEFGAGPPDFEEKPSISKIYENNNGTFAAVATELPGVTYGEALWSDYNGDNIQDFVLFGFLSQDYSNPIASFYTSYIAPEQDPLFVKDEASATLFENVFFSNASWADYDDDLDMDLLLTGLNGFDPISYIYENTGGEFVQNALVLPGIENGSAEWGAYTLGRRDILLAGMHDNQEFIEVFRYNGLDTYVAADANLKQLGDTGSGRATWGDIDNDDDLDILISGFDNFFEDNTIEETKLYLNDGGTYTETPTEIEPVADAMMTWGDYDNDGDLDLVISGDGINKLVHKVYTNVEGVFVENTSTLLEVFSSGESWGDYDQDGDLDLLFNGADINWNYHARIYENIDGVFVDINAGLIGSASGSVDWGDFDHDGDLDALVSGEENDLGLRTRIYQNDEGVFTEIQTNIPGIVFGAAQWVNVGNDQDLDVFITGFSEEGEVSELWINTMETNQSPMSLELSDNTLNQSSGNEIHVGNFSAIDLDEDDILTFSLLDGASENSNEYFTIVDNGLFAKSTSLMSPGDYVIRVLASDDNGGRIVKELVVQIIDDVAPVPLVHSDKVFYINQEGTLSIEAADIDFGSYDPMNEAEFIISIDHTEFDCTDLGENEV
ncbi:FG-GAP repeat domain-containing protein, partial [Reichenbachiella agariperforans]|uniref:FG-GAP repeat domain-containing protein n=1 Tax=Reichenbachiella agariperforans TaxID=156994 RepID=UPI001C0A6352